MAEARQTKTGRWRIFTSPGGGALREPGGTIPTFRSLDEARRWWTDRHPYNGPLPEAPKCARCGAYFGPGAEATVYAGRYYHEIHTPPAIAAGRGDSLDRS